MLSQILASDATTGYERFSDIQVGGDLGCSASLGHTASGSVPTTSSCFAPRAPPHCTPLQAAQPRLPRMSIINVAGSQCADPYVQRQTSAEPAAAGTRGGDVHSAVHGLWYGSQREHVCLLRCRLRGNFGTSCACRQRLLLPAILKGYPI